MLSIGITSRSVYKETKGGVSSNNSSLLTDKMKEIAPNDCHLFHGTRYNVLESMLKSEENPGSLRPFGSLDISEVKAGEALSQGGHVVNEENTHSISTCKVEDIAVPLKYALTSTDNEENYAVLFGIKIDPGSERVTETHFTDLGGFTDYTVDGNIGPEQISMVMVPKKDSYNVIHELRDSVLEHVQVRTFEDFFEAAHGWDDPKKESNSAYDVLFDLRKQTQTEHFDLNNHVFKSS